MWTLPEGEQRCLDKHIPEGDAVKEGSGRCQMLCQQLSPIPQKGINEGDKGEKDEE